MMPLELAISFVLPPQVGFGVAGAGEVRKGKQSKNIRFRIKSYVWEKLYMCFSSSSSLCNMQNVLRCYSSPVFLLLMQPGVLSRGRGKKLSLQKKKKKQFKSTRNVFNKEEVNYDNYSDW